MRQQRFIATWHYSTCVHRLICLECAPAASRSTRTAGPGAWGLTEGLWLAEGFTRYYEFLICTRTGIYSPQQFFSTVVNYYRHLEVLPAYYRVSAVDSSLAVTSITAKSTRGG